MHSRLLSCCACLALLGAACTGDGGEDQADVAPRPPADVSMYQGLGAWVDVYDYAPAFQQDGTPPDVVPDTLADVAALGVKTLYLQAAFADAGDGVVDDDLVGELLVRAHEEDVRVVAWYLPLLDDPDADLRRIRAMHDFEADGERFDSIALDIEWTSGVPDVAARNDTLVRLSEQAREIVGTGALGAIVLPPVQLEVVNPFLWPDFPWSRLAAHYDVWLPMAYWTFREGEHRDAYTYTSESVRRLRANLGVPDAPVHAVGGLASETTAADVEGLLRSVADDALVGWSLYDYDTTPTPLWTYLRRG